MKNKQRKGILLAGGTGSRLFPTTLAISKHLMPVYDKPMIFYSLSNLLLCGCTEICVITNFEYLNSYKKLFEPIGILGVKFTYLAQKKPTGIPESFIISEEWLNGSSCVLALGDNLIYGHNLQQIFYEAAIKCTNHFFIQSVDNPQDYGVYQETRSGSKYVIEKPKKPKSDKAVIGLYMFDEMAPHIASSLTVSKRGETEISEMINCYLDFDNIKAIELTRGVSWYDTGQVELLYDASSYVRSIQNRQGLIVCAPEEILISRGDVDKKVLVELSKRECNSTYEKYINNCAIKALI